MIIHRYTSAGGRDLILDYIDHLSYEEQVDGYHVMKCMEQGKLDELTMHQWQDKVWEVYFYKHNRIFYVMVNNNDIYLLHACRKQKNRTEKKDRNIVMNRAKELGKDLNIKVLR